MIENFEFKLRAFRSNEKEGLSLAINTSSNLFEIVLFENGKGTLQIDFQDYIITGNVAFFIIPNTVRSVSVTSFSACWVFSIDLKYLGLFSDNYQTLFCPFTSLPYSGLSLNEYAYLNTLFESIKQELESNYVKRKEAINTLTQLLFIRIEGVRMHKSSTGASPRHLSIFYSLLEEHFNTDKNVASYASRLNITSKQLNRLCLKFLGKNASKLIEERINLEAMRLLSYSSASIKEIAFGLGFEDPAYFSRYFKRINSISPNDFKTTMSDKYHSMVV